MKTKSLRKWKPFERAGGLRVPAELVGNVDPSGDWFINPFYQVQATTNPDGSMLLSIKPLDGSARHDWRELQWIKNEIAGPEREAVELFPAESRLVDTSNQFWLYVLPLGVRFPWGWTVRAVTEATLWPTSTQRPFPAEMKPEDLMSAEEARQTIRDYLAVGAAPDLASGREKLPRAADTFFVEGQPVLTAGGLFRFLCDAYELGEVERLREDKGAYVAWTFRWSKTGERVTFTVEVPVDAQVRAERGDDVAVGRTLRPALMELLRDLADKYGDPDLEGGLADA